MTGSIYQHTQRATIVLLLLVTSTIGAVIAGALTGYPVAWLVAIIMLVVAVLFSSMTVRVDVDGLHWHFGPGFWKKSLPLGDIATVSPVRNRAWYGWGIRYTPHGWLYNVSGLDAVELGLADGKSLRIGTDEPQSLCDAIRKARGRET